MVDKRYYEEEVTEREFLEWYKNQDIQTYEKPSNTVDLVTFRYNKLLNTVQLLLIKRKQHPYKDKWALAGGYIDKGESAEDAVIRETVEETGLSISYNQLDQLRTYTTPERDPRGWVNSIAYLVYVSVDQDSTVNAGDDAIEAEWVDIEVDESNQLKLTINSGSNKNKVIQTTDLAFDHKEIILDAVLRVRGQLDYKPIILNILGETFTMKEVKQVFTNFEPRYRGMSNSSFRTTQSKNLEEVGYEKTVKSGRPAKLYKLREEYKEDITFT